MNVRDIYESGNFEGHYVQSIAVSQISKTGSVYRVWLNSGECVEAKGHSKLSDLKTARRQSSNDRIQRYGEFGTSV